MVLWGQNLFADSPPQGVRIKDGVLQLVVEHNAVAASFSEDHQQHKPAYDYTCGELRTRADQRLRYGRIETRMRAPERTSASGYISSLFTYVNEAQGEYQEWEEIDVELEGGRPDKFQANLIYGRNTVQWWATRDYGAWEDKIEIGPVDSWRVYAIEWLPDQISWFIDGPPHQNAQKHRPRLQTKVPTSSKISNPDS